MLSRISKRGGRNCTGHACDICMVPRNLHKYTCLRFMSVFQPPCCISVYRFSLEYAKRPLGILDIDSQVSSLVSHPRSNISTTVATVHTGSARCDREAAHPPTQTLRRTAYGRSIRCAAVSMDRPGGSITVLKWVASNRFDQQEIRKSR